MKTEIAALEENETGDLVLNLSNQNIVDCKWLIKVKDLPYGSAERYKARLVARGFTQTLCVDYFDAYAHVEKMINIRLLLSIAASKN